MLLTCSVVMIALSSTGFKDVISHIKGIYLNDYLRLSRGYNVEFIILKPENTTTLLRWSKNI